MVTKRARRLSKSTYAPGHDVAHASSSVSTAMARAERRGLRSKRTLLGLYQGIPLTQRGSYYGMAPVIPDTITLYRKNIEAICRTDDEVRRQIVDTLIHEIGHYFGMNEDEIRSAGY